MLLIERGGWVMWPLLAASVTALALCLERGLFFLLIRFRVRLKDIEEVLDISADLPAKAEGLARARSGSPVMRVLLAGLEHRTSGFREALELAGEEGLAEMQRGMGVLDTIITLAPLLGILGTVLGIIDSFEVLGQMQISDPRAVTGGIAKALITTAAGLTIAIGTLIPYNYFQARIGHYRRLIEYAATRLEISLIRWLRRQGLEDIRPDDAGRAGEGAN